jgi:hypothetical protein
LLLAFITPTTIAKIYKWTDENGQVHYSQTPPPDQSTLKPIKGDKFPSEEDVRRTLLGEWRGFYRGQVIILKFNGKGTFFEWKNFRSVNTHVNSGLWEVSDKYLVMSYTQAVSEINKLGDRVSYKFVKVDQDYFTIKNKIDEEILFTRTTRFQRR